MCSHKEEIWRKKTHLVIFNMVVRLNHLPREQSPEQKFASYVLGYRTQSHPNSSKSIVSGHRQHWVSSESYSSRHCWFAFLLDRRWLELNPKRIWRYGAIWESMVGMDSSSFRLVWARITIPMFSLGDFNHILIQEYVKSN